MFTKTFAWNQGFSLYNDNTYDFIPFDGFRIYWNMNPEFNEYIKLLDIDPNELSEYSIFEDGYHEELFTKLKIFEDLKSLYGFLNNIPAGILINAFGENKTVIVSANNITIDYYYGD